MHRREYNMIAAALNRAKPTPETFGDGEAWHIRYAQWERVTHELSAAFKLDDPSFLPSEFHMAACDGAVKYRTSSLHAPRVMVNDLGTHHDETPECFELGCEPA